MAKVVDFIVWLPLIIITRYFELERNYVEKLHQNEITLKRDIQTIFSFNKSKNYQKEIPKWSPNSFLSKTHHQNCIEVHWKDLDLSSIKIILKKVHRNDVDFFPIEITLKKIHRNNVDFSLIDIMSNKVRRNGVDFLPIKSTSKKYVETARIFCLSKLHRKNTSKRRENSSIFFSTYRRNIDIESTLIQRVTAIGKVSIFFINVYHFFVHGLILISLNNIFSTKSSCHQS